MVDALLRDTVLDEGFLSRLAGPTAESTGLPNPCYTSDAWLDMENQRVFARTWMLAGFCHDIPGPGDAVPVEVAGIPIVVLRDDDGEVRAFHNVCRHRGAMIVQQPCSRAKVLTCPYHAWAYGLDGKLRTRPNFRGQGQHDVVTADTAVSHGLVPVRHAVWHDLIFVNISGDAPDFEEHWSPFAQRTAAYDFGALRHAKTLTFDIKGNWKLVYENYFDPYHVATVHPRLDAFYGKNRNAPETEGPWVFVNVEIESLQDGRGIGMPHYPGLDQSHQRMEWACHLFPTVCLQIWPDQLALFQLHAVAPDRTIEHIHMFFVGDAATDPAYETNRQSVYELWDELNTEDFTIVENMQLARRSPAFDGGILSPFWDPATQHFARLTIDAMRQHDGA